MKSFTFFTHPPKITIPRINIQPDGKIEIVKEFFCSQTEFDDYIHKLTQAFQGEYGPDEPTEQFSRRIPFDEIQEAEDLANAIVFFHGWDAISHSDGKLLITVNEAEYFIRVGSLGTSITARS